MLVINKKNFMFKIKEVHFSDYPFEMENCDILRFEYCKNKTDAEGFSRRKKLTLIIDLTQDLEIIRRNMTRQTKNRLNRAERAEIKIRISKDYDQFYKIYKSFIQKKDITSIFGVFGIGAVIPDTMKKYGTLFLAEHDGETLCGLICLEHPPNIFAWLAASKRLSANREKVELISNANRLLHWEAIKYAKTKQIKEYDFGGIWSEEEAEKDKMKKGINFFKFSFGGEISTRYTYQKIYSKVYELLCNLYNRKI